MPDRSLPLPVIERVDAAADRYESEWRADLAPRIENYLAAAPESDREALRQALLAVELELRGRGEENTSVTRSSVRSGGVPAPARTAEHVEGVNTSRGAIGRFETRGVLGSGA